jgi:predicted transcriptional regulator
MALQRSSRMLNISRETTRAHSCQAERHPPAIRASEKSNQIKKSPFHLQVHKQIRLTLKNKKNKTIVHVQ